jgi:hypothetical protein
MRDLRELLKTNSFELPRGHPLVWALQLVQAHGAKSAGDGRLALVFERHQDAGRTN